MRRVNIGLAVLLMVTPMGFPVANSVGAGQPVWDDPCLSHPNLCRFEKLPYIIMDDEPIMADHDGPSPGGCH